MAAGSDAGSPKLVEHLFRHESGRMLSALARILGLHNLDLAEDVVQETLLRALERWRFGGVPGYPFFAAAMGEMHRRAGRPGQAVEHYRAAIALARNPAEAEVFRQRLASCDSVRTMS
jgi:predicted RNA polymerase sigma factor